MTPRKRVQGVPRPEPAEGRGELVRDLINEIDVGKPPDDYWP